MSICYYKNLDLILKQMIKQFGMQLGQFQNRDFILGLNLNALKLPE